MHLDLISNNHARLRKGLLKGGLSKLPRLGAMAAAHLPYLAHQIKHEDWFQPAVVCRSFPVQWLDEKRCQIGEQEIEGEALIASRGANFVAVAFITLGIKTDEASTALNASGKTLEAYLLGEISLGALGVLSKRTEAYVRAHAAKRGMEIGSPIFPGDPGLDLSIQRQLYNITEPARAGIDLSSSGMIKPVKSLSLLIGIGNSMQRQSRSRACESCPSFRKCRRKCSSSNQ